MPKIAYKSMIDYICVMANKNRYNVETERISVVIPAGTKDEVKKLIKANFSKKGIVHKPVHLTHVDVKK